MINVGSRLLRVFVACVLALGAMEAQADSADVMLVLDLPPAAADEATQTQSVQRIAATLPTGARLGVVSADKPGGNLRIALMPAGEAADAFAATESLPAVDKDPAAAFERALYELRITGRRDVRHAVVFVGDAVAAATERRQWLRDSLTADAARMSTPVFVVAWGETADIELAQTMARSTGGDYFRAGSVNELEALMPQLKAMLASNPATAAVAGAEAAPQLVPAALPAPTPAAQVAPVAETHAVTEAAPAAPDRAADRLAGWVLAGLVGLGAVLGGAVAWWVAHRRAPQAGRGAVRATPTAYLVDVNGVTPLSRYVLGSRPVMIGRIAGKDTRLFDYITVPINTVSRRHAVIEYRDGAYWVVDQGSVNGTRVNDKRVKGKRALQHGDRIGLHRYELQFELAQVAADGDQTVAVTGTLAAASAAAVARAAAPAARTQGAVTEPPVNPTVVLSLDDVADPSPGDVTGPVPDSEKPAARKSSLDSFISTTLIQASPANVTQPTRPELPPRVAAQSPADATESAELSIDDFLDTGDAFAFGDDPPTPDSRSPQQTTQKLEVAVEGSNIDEYRLGDTINLFEPGQPVEETTPLERFLREHGGEPPPESNVLQGAWEQSRKK